MDPIQSILNLSKSKWQCEYCDIINDAKYKKCYVCEAPGNRNLNSQNEATNGNYIHNVKNEEKIEKKGSKMVNFESKIKVNRKGNGKKCKFCDSEMNEWDEICPICFGKCADYPESDEESLDLHKGLSVNLKSMEHTWRCSSCTFVNADESQCCKVCFTFRMSEEFKDESMDSVVIAKVPEDMSNEIWCCVRCKKENMFDSYMCKHCHTFAPFFHKWRCWKCSYFNDEIEEKCGKCREVNVKLKNDMERRMSLTSSTSSDDDSGALSFSNCIRCKKLLERMGKCFCDDCDQKIWYCNNKFCGAINCLNTHFCCKCEVQKGANITKENMVSVYNGRRYEKMWQCQSCGEFNNLDKCRKCDQVRGVVAIYADIKSKVSNTITSFLGKLANVMSQKPGEEED